jgi:hypothetical protein
MFLALCVVGALRVPTARAQGALPAGCTYQTCALRVEPGFFGPRLLRGGSGETVSKLGMFGGGVAALLTGPDSAAAFGRRYVTATRRSETLGLIGAIAVAVAIIRTDNFRDESIKNGDRNILLAGSVALAVSAPFGVQASRNLSRAVWWYNAALPR